MVLDTFLIRIYSFSSNDQSLSNVRVVIFTALAIVCTSAQFLILEYAKRQSVEIRRKRQLHLRLIHRIITFAQYTLTLVIALIILDMTITSSYSIGLEAFVVGITYGLGLTVLGLLSQRFFSWFKSNRNIIVILYGLSSSFLSINAALTLGFVLSIFLNSHAQVRSYIGGSLSPFIVPGSVADILNVPYIISTILSYSICWTATIFTLRYYSPKLRGKIYSVILILPLLYFLVQFLPQFQELILSIQAESTFFNYTVVFTFSKAVGGILFGLAFWIVARTLGKSNKVRTYLIMSAYGWVLLFLSNQAVVLVNITYPPFGLVTISFFGIASYLLLLGVYSSAISISEDSRLRQSIRQLALDEHKLLDSIGTAQMNQDIQRRVLTISKKTQNLMTQESGIQTSLGEDEMKRYVQEVLDEVHRAKTKSE